MSIHPTPPSRISMRWGCLDHSPMPPSRRNARRGHFYPLHLPLVFRCDGGVSTIPQYPPHVEMRDGGHFYPPHTSLLRFDAMEVFRPRPSAPSRRNARRGHFYPPHTGHTSLSCFDMMGGFDHSPIAPSHRNTRWGAFLPTPHLPLAFQRDAGVSAAPLIPPRVETQVCTHPTPPSCVSTQWGACNLLELN